MKWDAENYFDSVVFQTFCLELNIKNLYSTPRYPQSNRQAEATNKTILNALKKILKRAKGKWMDELPRVLWAYQTISKWPTRTTPFILAYGMEAIILIEIRMPTAKISVQLDWANEKRGDAIIQIASYHHRTIIQYNKRA
ncbi:hypothetical protein AAG906_016939 [Vitis piasezkii]